MVINLCLIKMTLCKAASVDIFSMAFVVAVP